MSKKRPSLTDGIFDEIGQGGSEPAAAVVSIASEKKATPKRDVVTSTMYLPRPVHQKLREIAFAKNCKIHDLVMDGIDRVLREHGHPSVEELRAK